MVTKIPQTGIADLAVGQQQLAADAVTAAKIVDGAVGAAEIDAGAVGTSEVADGTITADDLAATLDLSGKTVTLPAAFTPIFTKSYVSANQTISAGGLLTLAHGMGVLPKMVRASLVCTSAESGWAINDEVVYPVGVGGGNTGFGVYADTTNLYVRIGSGTSAIPYLNKTSGASVNLTNANWRAVFRAWA